MAMRKNAAKRMFPVDRNKWPEGPNNRRYYLDTPERVVAFMKAEPKVYMAAGILPPGFSREDSCCPFLPIVTRWTTSRIHPFDPPYSIEAIIAEPVWKHLAQLAVDYGAWQEGLRQKKPTALLYSTIWPEAFALPGHPLLRSYQKRQKIAGGGK